MAKVELDLLDNSLDDSNEADSEILGMVDDTPFGVAYRVVTVDGDDGTEDGSETVQLTAQGSATIAPNLQTVLTNPFDGQLYVIGNPSEVFGTTTSNKVTAKQNSRGANIPRKRDDRRRATHNEVERKRRDKINTWIAKLGRLVSGAVTASAAANGTNGTPPDVQSKGGILAKACEYISELSEAQERLTNSQRDNERLIVEVYRLSQEVSVLKKTEHEPAITAGTARHHRRFSASHLSIPSGCLIALVERVQAAKVK